jgi:hypothetical protein
MSDHRENLIKWAHELRGMVYFNASDDEMAEKLDEMLAWFSEPDFDEDEG